MSLNNDVVIYQFIGKRACQTRFYPPFNDSELRRLVARAYPAECARKHKELSILLKLKLYLSLGIVLNISHLQTNNNPTSILVLARVILLLE